jgi:hypothetical protein
MTYLSSSEFPPIGSQTRTIPTANELQKKLQAENPTWKLPERRVRKFLNRELQNQGKAPTEATAENDDESVVSTSVRARELAKATGRSLKKVIPGTKDSFFNFRKKKQDKQAALNAQALPPMTIYAPTTREEPHDEPKNEQKEQPEEALETCVEDKDESQDKEFKIFVDDNDGAKEDMMCANCVIL